MTDKEIEELKASNTELTRRVRNLERVVSTMFNEQKRYNERFSRLERVQNQFKNAYNKLETKVNGFVNSINNRRYRP